MNKSELVEKLAERAKITKKRAEQVVNLVFDQMSEALRRGERIEIRGFGSFSLHYRAPRIGRNPKTGESVGLAGKYVPHFKPGKELRERVNRGLQRERDGSPAPLRADSADGGASGGSAGSREAVPGPSRSDRDSY